uniref:Uncharacterized protein n=1 Tax=Aureoumbra lagunensis TaxID=44058 RepID=A0A7S3NN76_9STRA|mmetsp:Transcript_11748/g.15937  ORF Transcript_11748/g.15937 Transcript_11748/m.15937 type:complete len:479 (-) Transcript_11748:124-1560(-)
MYLLFLFLSRLVSCQRYNDYEYYDMRRGGLYYYNQNDRRVSPEKKHDAWQDEYPHEEYYNAERVASQRRESNYRYDNFESRSAESILIRELKELRERVDVLEEQLRSANLPTVPDEEMSLLEMFAGATSDFVLTKLLPRTHPECRWHWAKAVCVPKCKCQLAYRWGDLTMSRACRLVDEPNPNCDTDVRHERGSLEKLGDAIWIGSTTIWQNANEFLQQAAPPSDIRCDFSWQNLRCEPQPYCAFRYKFGDYHLGRACRRLDPVIATTVIGTNNTTSIENTQNAAKYEPKEEDHLDYNHRFSLGTENIAMKMQPVEDNQLFETDHEQDSFIDEHDNGIHDEAFLDDYQEEVRIEEPLYGGIDESKVEDYDSEYHYQAEDIHEDEFYTEDYYQDELLREVEVMQNDDIQSNQIIEEIDDTENIQDDITEEDVYVNQEQEFYPEEEQLDSDEDDEKAADDEYSTTGITTTLGGEGTDRLE